MCSIFGILGEVDKSKARYALSKLSHRGEDYCGIVERENLFFAHHLLSIVNSQNKTYQPFSHNNILLCFNGEIYNYKELRQSLQNEYHFNSDSDTEVIIAAYLKWGEHFVNHLRGMFAIAILDKDTLYLFRDRLGKKPLFFMQNKSFIFASEIKALIPFLNHCELNNDALLSYLSFLAPAPPHTFFKGIHKLAAGEYLIFNLNSGKYITERYYDILEIPPNTIKSKESAVAAIKDVLEESLQLRVETDLPIASLLSGGIDSATLNALCVRHGIFPQSYTVAYDGYSKYDESNNAAQTANYLGIKNKKVLVTQDDYKQYSEDILYELDEPLNDPAAIPLYMLFKEIAKDGYKIVLSGEGSDELFLGYRQYFEYLDIENISKLKHKNWLKNYFKANYSQNREWEYYYRIFNNSLLFRTSGESFTDLQKNNLMKRNVPNNQSLKYLNPYRERFENSLHSDESIWYSYIDLNLYQAEHYLTKLDRVSMAHTIESRTPFLDHKLVETVFSISPHLKYEDNITKPLLKTISGPLLTDTIINRKKKGFSNPYIEYLRDSNNFKVITEVNNQTNIFKAKELGEFLENIHQGGFKQHIWGLYVLSIWLKKHLL